MKTISKVKTAATVISLLAAMVIGTSAAMADGKPGKDGVDGKPGVAGIDGKDGKDGKDGAPGPKGDKGDTGLQGPKGDQGVQGVAGVNGQDGAKGDKGDKGDKGLAGKDYDPGTLERGLATTAALNVPHIDIGKKFGISGSAGFFDSEAAIGVGAAIRFDETWQLGGSVATDTNGKNVAGKAVISGQW